MLITGISLIPYGLRKKGSARTAIVVPGSVHLHPGPFLPSLQPSPRRTGVLSRLFSSGGPSSSLPWESRSSFHFSAPAGRVIRYEQTAHPHHRCLPDIPLLRRDRHVPQRAGRVLRPAVAACGCVGHQASPPPARVVKALPLETRYAPDRIYRTSSSALWRVSRDLGVLFSPDAGADVDGNATRACPARSCTRSPRTSPRSSRAWPLTLSTTTGWASRPWIRSFFPADAGETWQKMELKDPIRANDQLTCLSLAPGSRQGMMPLAPRFTASSRRRTGERPGNPSRSRSCPLKLGGGNYEEIASIAYDPSRPDSHLVRPGLRQRPLRLLKRRTRTWRASTSRRTRMQRPCGTSPSSAVRAQ